MDGDLDSEVLDREARQRAQQVMRKILLCRMRDLDVLFLVLMAALFYYLFSIIALLSKSDTSLVAGMATTTGPTGDLPDSGGFRTRFTRTDLRFARLSTGIDRRVSDSVLTKIRPITYTKGAITKELTTVNDPRKSIGKLYEKVKDAPSTSNLFDRTVEFARELDPAGDPEATARKIYPTLSLLDKTEELVDTVSAPSLAEFDHRKFEAEYEGFVGAFEEYLELNEKDDAEPPAEVLETREMLAAGFGAIAATGPQAVLANLGRELQERMAKIFAELNLEGYSKRHPGMEHKCGVPVGGTLILLFTHKNFVAQVLGKNQGKIKERVKSMRTKLKLDRRSTGIRNPEEITFASRTSDPIDDFVVLADFCVPYLCCDTDCSDIVLEPDDTPEPEPVAVKGTVFGVRGDTTIPLPRSEVKVTNLDTSQNVTVSRDGAAYSFTGPAGSYTIEGRL